MSNKKANIPEPNEYKKEANIPEPNEYRWVVEFMAGPGGYMQMAEIVSSWFDSFEDAKEDAVDNADREMLDYPYSRGKISKLFIEDKQGIIVEELKNARDYPKR